MRGKQKGLMFSSQLKSLHNGHPRTSLVCGRTLLFDGSHAILTAEVVFGKGYCNVYLRYSNISQLAVIYVISYQVRQVVSYMI